MRVKPLVLLVDDEEVFLEIASVKLQSEGMDTVLTKDVRDALTKAESLLPDLILSDIYMPPGPTGWDFALALRSNPKTRTIKFAFFTSLRDPWMELERDRRDVAARLGAVKFFSKTGDIKEIADEVLGMIKNSAA